MGIQYKPTKQKKEKPVKAPKTPKAEKPMSFGAAQTVKIEKPKKIKEPKAPKAPKPEKVTSFGKPGKVEKVESSAKTGSGALRQPVKPGVIIAVFAVVAVVLVGIMIASFFGGNIHADDEIIVKAQSISVAALPDKTVYYVGDQPTWYGLKVDVTLDNGMTVSIKGTDCEITGFDSSAPAESQTVTLSYDGCSTTFDVTILGNAANSGSSEITGLSFKTLPKTEYKVGEYKSVQGGVLLLQYEDGTTEELTLHYENIFDFTTEAPGTYTVTVKVIINDKLYTTTYTITVTE